MGNHADMGEQGIAAAKSLKIAFVAIVCVGLIGFAAFLFSPTHDEDIQAQLRQQQQAASIVDRNSRALASLKQYCKLTDDASGLFVEVFQESYFYLGKLPRTREATRPLDMQVWSCSNGTRYWSKRGEVPTGFLVDYKSSIEQQPRNE